jgi:hypothetical protein
MPTLFDRWAKEHVVKEAPPIEVTKAPRCQWRDKPCQVRLRPGADSNSVYITKKSWK